MQQPRKTRSGATPGSRFPESIRKHYSAPVSGDGRVLPILESVGRRLIREIDPDSSEGRKLLDAGRVALWSATKGGPRRAVVLGRTAGSEGAATAGRGKRPRLPGS